MTHAAITVEKLSKVYRLGVKDETPDTIASAFTGALRSPLRNWRRLRRLSRFAAGDDSEDALWALRDVSFEVAEGEVLGVIGRNGAGKSTLLKVLSRITEPTTGRAIIRGRVSSLLEVGTGFHPELTGRENIYMNGTILGMRKREIDRKFDEIVEFSGVEKFLDTPIKRYSSGMNVRLAFAVAAHLEPEILIIDEVLAVGDMEFQKKCLGKMHDVAAGGRTVLFVSHNMAALESLCTYGLYLSQGRLEAIGEIDDVIERYRRHAPDAGSASSWEFLDSKYLRRIELFNSVGQPTSVVPIGQDVRLRFAFEAETALSQPRLIVRIDDLLGHHLIDLQPPLNNNCFTRLNGAVALECVIHDFPLAPGQYGVSVYLMGGREVVEERRNCATINVVNAPVFDHGRGFDRGICIARSSWSLCDSPPLSEGTAATAKKVVVVERGSEPSTSTTTSASAAH